MPDVPETPEELAREAGRGRSERTPWLALSGVTIAIAIVFALVVGIALLAYFVS